MGKSNKYLDAAKLLRIRKNWFSITHGDNIQAYDLAIEALEKQVPQKPINQSTWKACPVCEQGIGVTRKTPNPRAKEYCFHCGQKLDWD